jgi:hypothetical protein
VRDLVYLPARTFDRAKTVEISSEIGAFNARLGAEGRPYVLIGPGRWGSADRWLGIPVSWSQVSHAACMVETDMHDMRVAPSQGTHFFQNITSLGIPYFTVNFEKGDGLLDMEWLDGQQSHSESEHVRHLRFDAAMEIAVSGRNQKGAILRPGKPLFPTP